MDGHLTTPRRMTRLASDAVACGHDLLAIAAREPDAAAVDYDLQARVTEALQGFVERCGTVGAEDVKGDQDAGLAVQLYREIEATFLRRSSFYRHLTEKPFGYAGDFLAMEYIYARHCDRGFAGYVDRWLQSTEAARAVRARKRTFVRLVQESVTRKPAQTLRVLDVGAGSCIPVLAALEAGRADVHFTCMDADAQALARARFLLETSGDRDCVSLAHRSIVRMAREEAAGDLGKFDLVWCGGVFDYLNDRKGAHGPASAVLRSLLRLLLDEGKLIVVNFGPSLKERAYLPRFLSWPLVYRDESSFTALAEELVTRGARVRVSTKRHGPLTYATFQRQ